MIKTSKLLWIALFILVILFLIFKCGNFISCKFVRDKKNRIDSTLLLNKSNGTYDFNAQKGIDKLQHIKNKNADDYYNIGTVLENNLLQGHLISPNKSIISSILSNYNNSVDTILHNNNSTNNNTTTNNTNNSQFSNKFIISKISDFETKITPFIRINTNNIKNNQYLLIQQNALQQNNQHRDTQERALLSKHLRDEQERILEDIRLTTELMRENARLARNIRIANDVVITKDIVERKKEAKQESSSKRDEINKYYEKGIIYTQDRQNVHDSVLNNEMNKIIKVIKLGNTTQSDHKISHSDNNTINLEILHFIDTQYSERNNSDRVDKAKKTLEKCKENSYSVSYDDNENNILKYIWLRSKLPINAHNSKKIKEAIIDSMIDCWENNMLVCINGRCSRYVSALATIDGDGIVDDVKTKEAYQNEILEKARLIFNTEIENAKKSDIYRDIGNSYENVNLVVDEKLEREFKNMVIQKINIMIEENYSNKFNSDDLQNIKRNCQFAIE